MRIKHTDVLTLLAALALAAAPAFADEPNEIAEEAPAEAPAPMTESPTQPAPAGEDTAAPEDPTDQTMRELMELRRQPAVVDPLQPGPAPQGPPPSSPASNVEVDRAVIGVAPGARQPQLRREGEFIVSRRGRLVRTPDGAHLVFAFEADGPKSPEAPMILLECQYLETMENIVQQYGDTTVFIVSGQVHTYRGHNYLLPTMMKLAQDQGNLQP